MKCSALNQTRFNVKPRKCTHAVEFTTHHCAVRLECELKSKTLTRLEHGDCRFSSCTSNLYPVCTAKNGRICRRGSNENLGHCPHELKCSRIDRIGIDEGNLIYQDKCCHICRYVKISTFLLFWLEIMNSEMNQLYQKPIIF